MLLLPPPGALSSCSEALLSLTFLAVMPSEPCGSQPEMLALAPSLTKHAWLQLLTFYPLPMRHLLTARVAAAAATCMPTCYGMTGTSRGPGCWRREQVGTGWEGGATLAASLLPSWHATRHSSSLGWSQPLPLHKGAFPPPCSNGDGRSCSRGVPSLKACRRFGKQGCLHPSPLMGRTEGPHCTPKQRRWWRRSVGGGRAGDVLGWKSGGVVAPSNEVCSSSGCPQ